MQRIGGSRDSSRCKGERSVKKEEVLAEIHQVGVMPGIRTSSAEDGRFAADAIAQGGIPIVGSPDCAEGNRCDFRYGEKFAERHRGRGNSVGP